MCLTNGMCIAQASTAPDLRGLDRLGAYLPFFTKNLLLFGAPAPSKKGSTPFESVCVSGVDPFSKGRQINLTELPSLP